MKNVHSRTTINVVASSIGKMLGVMTPIPANDDKVDTVLNSFVKKFDQAWVERKKAWVKN